MRILTDGAMDLFHPGHIRLLRRIKEQYPVARRRIKTDRQGRKIRELAARPWLAQRLANLRRWFAVRGRGGADR